MIKGELIHELGIGTFLLSIKSNGMGGSLLASTLQKTLLDFEERSREKEVLLKVTGLSVYVYE